MILLLKIHASCKIFDKIMINRYIDTFFSNMWSVIKGQGTQFFSGCDIQQKGKVQTFWLGRRPPRFPSLKGHPDLPIKKTLRRVLDMLTVMILNRVSESVFFQINLLKAIYPFQGRGA